MDEKKMLVAGVRLMVTRDSMTRLPVTVPAHEVEIMQALHGQENVQVLDEKTGPIGIDPEFEGERLTQKYGRGLITELYGSLAGPKLAKAAAEHQVKKIKAAA
jgi:hypothetical protein